MRLQEETHVGKEGLKRFMLSLVKAAKPSQTCGPPTSASLEDQRGHLAPVPTPFAVLRNFGGGTIACSRANLAGRGGAPRANNSEVDIIGLVMAYHEIHSAGRGAIGPQGRLLGGVVARGRGRKEGETVDELLGVDWATKIAGNVAGQTVAEGIMPAKNSTAGTACEAMLTLGIEGGAATR